MAESENRSCGGGGIAIGRDLPAFLSVGDSGLHLVDEFGFAVSRCRSELRVSRRHAEELLTEAALGLSFRVEGEELGEACGDHVADRQPRMLPLFDQGFDSCADSVEAGLVGGSQKCVLGIEVVLDESDRDLRGGGHAGDRDGAEPGLRGGAQDGVDDLLASLGVV